MEHLSNEDFSFDEGGTQVRDAGMGVVCIRVRDRSVGIRPLADNIYVMVEAHTPLGDLHLSPISAASVTQVE